MKKVLTLVLSATLALSLAACGAKNTDGAKDSKNDSKVITVGASPAPHAEILEVVKEDLSKKGYELKIEKFTDYKTPNIALDNKDLDANFFQHVPYLEKEIKEKGYNLDYTVKVHLEPIAFYSKKIKDIKELQDGAKIAVPNDPTNEARALRLLEKAGLIKLKEGELVTVRDIVENPKNLKISELEGAQIPRSLADVDGAVINTNFAFEAGLTSTKDGLLVEDKDSPYANILAVRKDNKDSDAIKALSESLTSDKVKEFINEKYKGSILPSF